MSNTKHTPGPWNVSPSAKASTLTRIFDETGKLVASANGPGLSEGGEAEANARLIAAAPELLEALSFLLEAATPGNFSPSDKQLAFDKARAAIAKATQA